jgi:hypothetical protein
MSPQNLMKTDPRLSSTEVESLSREILLCQRLLRKLWSEENRRDVFARRRACFRALYGIPLGVRLPIDWEPAPHPRTARLS